MSEGNDYYGRTSETHTDGTPKFSTARDEKNQNEVARLIEAAWSCECRSFGALAPIDWYFVEHGRFVGVGELKCRTHESTRYETVFLNLRKWLSLTLAAVGCGVTALYIVRFTDRCLWVPVNEIDASRVIIGGCAAHVKSRNDIEPLIEVPIKGMRILRQKDEPNPARD